MVSATVEDDRLLVEGDPVELRYPPAEAVTVDEVVAVRLDVPHGGAVVDNVVGVSPAGDRIWTVDNPVTTPSDVDVYVSVWTDGGDLWAASFADAHHRIDPETGAILEKRQVR